MCFNTHSWFICITLSRLQCPAALKLSLYCSNPMTFNHSSAEPNKGVGLPEGAWWSMDGWGLGMKTLIPFLEFVPNDDRLRAYVPIYIFIPYNKSKWWLKLTFWFEPNNSVGTKNVNMGFPSYVLYVSVSLYIQTRACVCICVPAGVSCYPLERGWIAYEFV